MIVCVFVHHGELILHAVLLRTPFSRSREETHITHLARLGRVNNVRGEAAIAAEGYSSYNWAGILSRIRG